MATPALSLALLLLGAGPAAVDEQRAAAIAPPGSSGRIVHVASDAHDDAHADGSLAHPFTLGGARRSLSGEAAGATVLLRGGDYQLREPFVLAGPADGGAPGEPVTYASYPGERARLLGGVEVPPSAFRPVAATATTAASSALHSAPTGLLVADLRALGVSNSSMLGDGGAAGLKAELFVSSGDGAAGRLEPCQLAQDPNPWPNGTWEWAGYSEILASNTSWFVLNARDTPRTRLDLWGTAVNLSLYGHWDSDYGDMKSYRVMSMVPISVPTRSGGGGSGGSGSSSSSGGGSAAPAEAYNITLDSAVVVAPGKRFVATDALALVDTPGEYWIDRQELKLYLLPPHPMLHEGIDASSSSGGDSSGGGGGSSYFLSLGPSLADPSASAKALRGLVELHSVPHIRLVNLTVAVSTQSLLIASQNGTASGLEIEDCAFIGAGSDCVSATDLANSWIRGSTIAQCGGTGLTLTGGTWAPDSDELSLFDTPDLPADLWVPANVSLIDSQLHHWARWQRIANRPGIIWSGTGHFIRGCTIENAPSPAILNQGSMDFVLEGNSIASCPYEYNDMGAYYHGGSAGGYQYGWTQTGNVIRGNSFRNIRFVSRVPATDDYNFTLNGLTTQAVYLDDGHSGYTVRDNHFHGVEMGIVLGGGRRHTVVNNTFDVCDRACVHIDNRGMNWAHELCGCQCSFGTCEAGCNTGPAIGPGLNETDWTVLNTSDPAGVHGYPPFRFEQGARKLRCVGPNASAPCTVRLPWLAGMLHDATGGGLCAPAHNLVTNNSFKAASCRTPWQLCGFIENVSDFTLECSLHTGPDLKVVDAWGSHAEGNTLW
jgi:hypothetical protein